MPDTVDVGDTERKPLITCAAVYNAIMKCAAVDKDAACQRSLSIAG